MNLRGILWVVPPSSEGTKPAPRALVGGRVSIGERHGNA